MNLGDLFLSLRGESQQLVADATKAGSAAGEAGAKTFGEKFSGAASKLLQVGLAGAFAFATKRLVELDNAVAKFTADTGASADEAKAAGQAINDMAGKNLQPIAEIGDTLAAVTTNMGLQGEEAVALTEKILKYATATGQDAVEATQVADDLMDRYRLTASDLAGVMDSLVANTHKYGGSVKVQQQALADIAPVLEATNASWQDGVAILGFFETAGINSAEAANGLNRAVKSLKPGQTIQTLFDQISAIPDPAKRAAEAIRLFGRGGGPDLARALGAGRVELKNFGLTAEETTGAVDKAADAITGTLQNKIALGLKQLGTVAADVLGPVGPLATGLASIVSLAGPFVGSILKLTVPGMAAGTTVGTAIGRAMSLAIPAALIISAAIIAEKLQGPVQDAGKSINKTWTDALGVADRDQGALHGTIFDSLADGIHAAADAGRDWGVQFGPDGSVIVGLGDLRSKVEQAANVLPSLASGYDQAGDAANKFAAAVNVNADAAGEAARQTAAETAARQASIAGMEGEGARMAAEFQRQGATVAEGQRLAAVAAAEFRDKAAVGLAEMIANIQQASNDAKVAAGLLPSKIGSAILAGASTLHSSLSELQRILKEGLTPKKVLAEAMGHQIVKDVAAGIKRGDPIAVGAARTTALDAIAAIAAAGKGTGGTGLAQIGKLKTLLFASGMTSGQVNAVLAARGIVTATGGGFSTDPGVFGYGEHLGQRYVSGIRSQADEAASAARDVLHSATGVLRQAPGPHTDPEVFRMGPYGQHTIDRWIAGLRSRLGVVAGLGSEFASTLGAGLAMADVPGAIGGFRADTSGSMTVEHYHHLDPADAARLREAGFDDRAIGAGLLDASTRLRNRRAAARLPVGSR